MVKVADLLKFERFKTIQGNRDGEREQRLRDRDIGDAYDVVEREE